MNEAQRDELLALANDAPRPEPEHGGPNAGALCSRCDAKWGRCDCPHDVTPQLAEAVRALVGEVERLQIKLAASEWAPLLNMQAARDAALARAEKAEAERDDYAAKYNAAVMSFNKLATVAPVGASRPPRVDRPDRKPLPPDVLAGAEQAPSPPTGRLLSSSPVFPVGAPRDACSDCPCQAYCKENGCMGPDPMVIDSPAPARTEVERTVEAIAAWLEDIAERWGAIPDTTNDAASQAALDLAKAVRLGMWRPAMGGKETSDG